MCGARGVAVAGVVVLMLAGCATVEIRQTRVVGGQITDESGRPVSATPVVVVGRSLDLATTQFQYVEQGRQELRAATDAQGRFRLEFVPADLGNNFFLFFYDKTGFDGVKYRRPEPLDITLLLRRDRDIIVNQVLQFAAGWPEVARQIDFYGAESERGKILRKFGLPEKREQAGTGGDSEVWWYYADGVSYWFTGGKLTTTQEFQPIPTGTPAR
ncbi:MAG TPA: carboxypeptidase-like regulatory domain-containing protein [Candidatus Methylomirabilis sp.]|nr:carboxypeptidase-like regulatory domain-containing protein [Candidatus Methylomirabilis sp.]